MPTILLSLLTMQAPTCVPGSFDPASRPPAVQLIMSSEPSNGVSEWVGKREDYISWDDYFMAVAFLSAQRSKDPGTQVGACIVNKDNRIVGIGYNGFPCGVSDDDLPWARSVSSGDPLQTKYPFVCHAEMNAIMNKNSGDLNGCRIYVALFPCNECSKLIIQAHIAEVIYYSDKYHDDWKFVASRKLLDLTGVKYRQHVPSRKRIVIDFEADS
eukprot:TRINITY_DN11631_c0_g1_i1.p1 TRINITY_DN11631_c0_g1~~TRINITY_DN11631_c0_g1_i1.p1  ORF type:complete len:213 (+),score=41.90 TRINITY_DN11631_c0_g1_i1:525-1163(+)